MLSIAFLIWIFYYRRGNGTMLWVPRPFARFLSERTKSAKSGAEAFSLGLSSVFGELLFIIAPLSISALVILQLPNEWSIFGALTYVIVSLLSLIIVWILVGSGHNLSKFQKWREANKHFLQFAAGAGLIALGLFVYVEQIVSHILIGV
jgi:cytochrome c biogenesis protein CcdA